MAREGIQIQMSTAIHTAITKQQGDVQRAARVKTNGGTEKIDVTINVIPHTEGEQQLLILSFQEPLEQKPTELKAGDASMPDAGRVSALEEELPYYEREFKGHHRGAAGLQ